MSLLAYPLSPPTESPEDYESVNTLLTFNANEAERCVRVDIVDSARLEQTESFGVTLERTPGLDERVHLNPTAGIIIIVNDDSEFNFYIRVSVVWLCLHYSDVSEDHACT